MVSLEIYRGSSQDGNQTIKDDFDDVQHLVKIKKSLSLFIEPLSDVQWYSDGLPILTNHLIVFTKCSTGQYLWVTSGFIYSDVINWLKHFKTNTMWASAKTSIYLSLPWPKILNISDIFFLKLKLEIFKLNVINVPSVSNVPFIVEQHQNVLNCHYHQTHVQSWLEQIGLCIWRQDEKQVSIKKKKKHFPQNERIAFWNVCTNTDNNRVISCTM